MRRKNRRTSDYYNNDNHRNQSHPYQQEQYRGDQNQRPPYQPQQQDPYRGNQQRPPYEQQPQNLYQHQQPYQQPYQQPQYQQPQPQYQQQPLQNGYNVNDRPVVIKEDKTFITRELRLIKIRSLTFMLLWLSVVLALGIVIALFVIPSFGLEYGFTKEVNEGIGSNIQGWPHLIWMGIALLASGSLFLIYTLKYYISKKDSQRARLDQQQDYFVPLTLKKQYRGLRTNNTFIHYFSFLIYITSGAIIGIMYGLSQLAVTAGGETKVIVTEDVFSQYALIIGIAAGITLLLHIVVISMRLRKATLYDARFGSEIIPREEIIALKKRNRKICIIISLTITIILVLGYILLRKFSPSILPSTLK